MAAHDFEVLVEALLDAAPQEHVMRRLGQALARTTRLVNTLEQRVSVKMAKDLATIRRTLEEREREEHEHLRLKRLIARRTWERGKARRLRVEEPVSFSTPCVGHKGGWHEEVGG